MLGVTDKNNYRIYHKFIVLGALFYRIVLLLSFSSSEPLAHGELLRLLVVCLCCESSVCVSSIMASKDFNQVGQITPLGPKMIQPKRLHINVHRLVVKT